MTHTTESLNKLTRAQVYKIAKEVAKVNSLRGFHHLKKAELIELILNYDEVTSVETTVEAPKPVDAGALVEAAQKHNAAKAKKVKKDEVISFAEAVKLVQQNGYDTITVDTEKFKVYLVSGSNQIAFLLPRDAVQYATANPVVKAEVLPVEPESCDVLEGWVGKSCDVLEGWTGDCCQLPVELSPKAQNTLHKKNLDKALKSHKRFGITIGEIDYLSFSVDVYYGTTKLGRVGCNVLGQHWFSYGFRANVTTKVASFDAALTMLIKQIPAKKAA